VAVEGTGRGWVAVGAVPTERVRYSGPAAPAAVAGVGTAVKEVELDEVDGDSEGGPVEDGEVKAVIATNGADGGGAGAALKDMA
jgi:hypothetical protein